MAIAIVWGTNAGSDGRFGVALRPLQLTGICHLDRIASSSQLEWCGETFAKNTFYCEMEKNEIENKPDDISGVKIDGKRNMASVSLIKRTVLFNE